MKVHYKISPFQTEPVIVLPELLRLRERIIDFIDGFQFIGIEMLMIRRKLS